MMNFDFLDILTYLTIFSGVICLVDFFLRKRRPDTQPIIVDAEGKRKHPWLIEYARAFFPVFLIVLLIRAFIAQPYRVPSGSLEPTVLPGDMILVTQFDYGFRLPLWNKKIIKTQEPKHGQIALFHWPVNHKATFVKRVIGLPGDKISYMDKVLYVNGQKASQTYVKDAVEIDGGSHMKQYEENLLGIKHFIYINPNRSSQDFKDLVVPEGHYFMMGDNRDDSDDSRNWGFVSESELIGKARFILLNWDSKDHRVRWDRIGMRF